MKNVILERDNEVLFMTANGYRIVKTHQGAFGKVTATVTNTLQNEVSYYLKSGWHIVKES